MSLETYSDTIRTKVEAVVPGALSTGQLAKPNEPFKPTIGTPWVAYTMNTLDNRNRGMGSHATAGHRTNEGQVILRCFVPVNAGADDAAALAEEVAGALRGETFTGGHFKHIRLLELGADGEGWYQYNVIAEFYHQEAA